MEGAARGAPPERSAEVRRRLSTVDAGCVCVAGAALGAPRSHFAWQAQHLEHLSLILHGRRSTWTPESHFARQVQHWKHLSCILRLRGNTINTTPSTQHHQHNIIYRTPSTQHHQHNTIYTTSSQTGRCQHLEHCHLTQSASFLLIPLLLFFVVACSLFCFVDLFHTWMSEDIINMWGYLVL